MAAMSGAGPVDASSCEQAAVWAAGDGTVPRPAADQAQKLQRNWTVGAPGYADIVDGEMHDFRRQVWTDLILSNAGRTGRMRILDVGTGPGFFATIMSLAGNDVTAVDCTEAMLDEARATAARWGASPTFLLSDTMSLPFADDTFDLVISRNVVWTILEPERALSEWLRVLAPGGRMIAFDANWNIRMFDEAKRAEYERDRAEAARRFPDVPLPEYSDDMEDFRHGMPLCRVRRPAWDVEALERCGYRNVVCEEDLRSRVYDEREQIINRSTPMFMVRGDKPSR